MQVRVNKEIRQYRESLFFGLSARQFFCAAAAIAVTVGLYFALRHGGLGKETASWVCILGGAPIAAAGFFSYNGLTFEQFLWAVIKSEVLLSGQRLFKAQNYYYDWFTQQKPGKDDRHA